MTTPWSEAETAKLLELRRNRVIWEQVAGELGRSVEACRSRHKKATRFGAQAAQPVAKSDVAAMEAAALRQKVAKLEAELAQRATGLARVNVTTEAEQPHEPAELWLAAEAENARRIEYTQQRGRFEAKFDEPVIGISFISDQHIAPGTPVDMRRMRADAELIANTPGLYAILGGDGVDNHIKHRAAIMAARSQPHDQYVLFEWYLEVFASKIIALISGNHDKWTDEIGGVDMLARIAKSQRLFYAPSEAIGTVRVGETSYGVAVRHQYRMNSSYNQTHAVKQWFRMGADDWDIGCVGHHHEAAIECFVGKGKRRWACRPGSYQIRSSYSHQYGYNDAEPTCPTFLLFAESRRILGFADVHDAVVTLEAERDRRPCHARPKTCGTRREPCKPQEDKRHCGTTEGKP